MSLSDELSDCEILVVSQRDAVPEPRIVSLSEGDRLLDSHSEMLAVMLSVASAVALGEREASLKCVAVCKSVIDGVLSNDVERESVRLSEPEGTML